MPSTSPTTSAEIGTLIVVVLKAKNLPNKRHIGKQDPYCTLRHGGETKRTKALKRGGQHPEWDEELRFTIFDDPEDEGAQLTETANGQPPPPPPKEKKKKRKIKGGLKMLVTCFADDPREPVFIGETTVDLTEALTKGETDEWFTLTNKEKYCGEVYLELTFWSNEKPPGKKPKRPSAFNPQYGGPGSFTPSSDGTLSSATGGSPARTEGSSISSLKSSSSIASVNLYQPPYERQSRHSDVDRLASQITDLSVDPSPRRESLPPPSNNIGYSEFGYNDSPSRMNGTYNTLPSTSSISSIHSIQSSPSSLNPHHRNTLTTLPEGLVPGGDAHSPSTPNHSSRIPSTSYHSSPSSAPSGYDLTPVDNYPPQSSNFLFPAAFPEPEIPIPSRTPVPYSYDIVSPPPPPVASSGFVTTQPTPPSSGYSPTVTHSSFSYPSQPLQAPYQPPQPPRTPPQPPPSHTPLQPPQTPFQPPPPPPPLNSYPIQSHVSTSRPPEGYNFESNSPESTNARYENPPTHTPPSPQPPPPVNAFQRLQGSRPLPSPQVRTDQAGLSNSSALPSSGAPGSLPGPPPPPPPPVPLRHRPSLPPTPSLTPSVSYPPPPPPSHPISTFSTPPPPPPSQYLNHSSQSPSHYMQSSFNQHQHHYSAPEILPSHGPPHQPYAYATPPAPSHTPTLPYQPSPQWHTPPYNSGYTNTPPRTSQTYSSPIPPSVMPMPDFYSNVPPAPPYGYPPSNQYGW